MVILATKFVGDDRLYGLNMRQILSGGWRLLTRHKKAVFFFYLTNVMVAAFLLVPFMEVFDHSLGLGLYREQMVHALDYDWYTLFVDRVTGFASTFAPWVMGAGPFAKNMEALLNGEITQFPWEILCLGGVYVFLQTFLLGATLGSLSLNPKGTSTRQFFQNGVIFFGRFFRLAVLALLTFWVLDSWIIEPLAFLVNKLSEGALTDRGASAWNLVYYLLMLLVFMIVNMLFDYAKIKVAIEDSTSIILSFLAGVNFCKKHFLAAFGLYLGITMLGVIGVLIYTGVEHVLPQRTWLPIVVAIFWQQLYVLGRLSIKLFFYTSQVQFYLQRQDFKQIPDIQSSN